jgi:hypothetical protein
MNERKQDLEHISPCSIVQDVTVATLCWRALFVQFDVLLQDSSIITVRCFVIG